MHDLNFPVWKVGRRFARLEKREDERREIAMHERLPEALLGRLRTRKWEEPEETQGLRSAPLQRQLTVDKQPDGTR